jgi:type IV pilus assembly protein PilW
MQNKNCAGLSIVEALVTMVILLITLGGVYQIFQSNSLTYRMQEGLARVQENGRFAMDFLVNDIRMAGYQGCVGHVPINNTLNNATEYNYNIGVGIEGFDSNDEQIYQLTNSEGTWSNSTHASISNNEISTKIGISNVLKGGDILTIRRQDDLGISITKHPGGNPPGSADIQVDAGNMFNQFDIVIVSDCIAAAVFQISNANPSSSGNIAHNKGVGVPGNNIKELGKEFTGGEISKTTVNTYYIDINNSSTSSLFKRIASDPSSQELVEGIENMQFLYGEDTNGDRSVDTYVNAASVTNWEDVRSVKIGLLVSTIEEIRGMDENNEIYDVLGTNIGPANDLRIRRVFTATVGLRNRLK